MMSEYRWELHVLFKDRSMNPTEVIELSKKFADDNQNKIEFYSLEVKKISNDDS